MDILNVKNLYTDLNTACVTKTDIIDRYTSQGARWLSPLGLCNKNYPNEVKVILKILKMIE